VSPVSLSWPYLSHGHLPGQGPYGDTIDRVIDFVADCQRENGLLSYLKPVRVPERLVPHNSMHTAAYNHAIAGLLLCEVFGMTDEADAGRMRAVIKNALRFTRRLQSLRINCRGARGNV